MGKLEKFFFLSLFFTFTAGVRENFSVAITPERTHHQCEGLTSFSFTVFYETRHMYTQCDRSSSPSHSLAFSFSRLHCFNLCKKSVMKMRKQMELITRTISWELFRLRACSAFNLCADIISPNTLVDVLTLMMRRRECRMHCVYECDIISIKHYVWA